MQERVNAIQVMLMAFLAGLGGAVKFIAQSMIETFDRPTPMVYALKLTGSVVVSGFTGLMMALFISRFTSDLVWQFIAAGVSGYVGPSTLDMLFNYLKTRFLAQP